MNQEEIKNSILERFNNLQPEIQTAIMDPTYENNISEMGKKYNLSVEQIANLELNTTLVMLGQIHPDDYNEELFNDLDLPQNEIDNLVMDINEKILKPIKDLLKKNFEDDIQLELEPKESIPFVENEILKTTDDEVPLPPYAKIITNDQLPITVEKKVITDYKLPMANDSTSNKEEGTPKENPVVINKPDEELKYIPKNVFEDKMKAPTSSDHSVSDHSKSKVDPYREEF